jgi:hypothetical protein
MKLAFGGLIALILLCLYGYAVIFAVVIVLNGTPEQFTDGYVTTMSTVGGLVSALVIAELAVTEPGKPPAARALTAAGGVDPSATALSRLTWVTAAYLLAWVALGLAAYIVGVMQHPSVLTQLTDLGRNWLGLAVASAYAYFGIKPPGG